MTNPWPPRRITQRNRQEGLAPLFISLHLHIARVGELDIN